MTGNSMKDRLCLGCFQRRASVCVTCDACGSEEFIGLTTRQIERFEELTRPRRVEVTAEQARKITKAHEWIESQQLEIDALQQKIKDHEKTIAAWRGQLAAVMAEINGEEAAK